MLQTNQLGARKRDDTENPYGEKESFKGKGELEERAEGF